MLAFNFKVCQGKGIFPKIRLVFGSVGRYRRTSSSLLTTILAIVCQCDLYNNNECKDDYGIQMRLLAGVHICSSDFSVWFPFSDIFM